MAGFAGAVEPVAAVGSGDAFLAGFVALYMPVRFVLDFLRVSDVRYAGLTPAQWAAAASLAALGAYAARARWTARAGRAGDAWTLVEEQEVRAGAR